MPGYTHFITDQRRLSAPFQIPKRHIRSPSPQLRTSATHSSTISTLSNSETPHPKPLTPAAYLRFPFFHYQHPFKFRNATSEAPRPSCVPPLPILPLSAPFQIPKRHIRSSSPQLRTSATHSSTISTLSNSETPHPKPLTPAAYLRYPFFHYQHPFKFRNTTSEAPHPSCVPPLPILPLSYLMSHTDALHLNFQGD